MLRARVKELHYITSSANLVSIATHGLLSHKRAQHVPHVSVANLKVQNRRAPKILPNQRSLHEYVNLYFDARNPMMYSLMADGAEDLVIVRVSSDVLDFPGTILTDGNGASDSTKFLAVHGLEKLDESKVYAVSWNAADPFQKIELKRLRCAEVLVPDMVAPDYLNGCYVPQQVQRAVCAEQVPDWTVEVWPRVFFR